MRRSALAILLLGSLSPSAMAEPGDPQAWFDKAVQYDLNGTGKDAARLAFRWYMAAAEAGLPAAEFNVGVMLDSGRGVDVDLAKAATWYARAAAHGDQRAAYNMGQLYQTGQGVPLNNELARAWFVASALPAAQTRIAADRTRPPVGALLTAPTPVGPVGAQALRAETDGIELVWTSRAQPEPVHFYVELRRREGPDWREVFKTSADTSSVLARVPQAAGDYAWRVVAVARRAARYAASGWVLFHAAPEAISTER